MTTVASQICYSHGFPLMTIIKDCFVVVVVVVVSGNIYIQFYIGIYIFSTKLSKFSTFKMRPNSYRF